MVAELGSMAHWVLCMSWIDDFKKSSYGLYAGNTLEAFQPLDFFHFYGLWYDLWLDEIIKCFEILNIESKPHEEIAALLPTPSNLRALLQKAIPAYIGGGKIKKDEYKRYTNYLASHLMWQCPTDPFGLTSTPLHRAGELAGIVQAVPWQKADSSAARTLGKLVTVAGSLVHGLYNDVVTDFGWDTYGPYGSIPYLDSSYTMMVRNFPDMQPQFWASNYLAHYKQIQIFNMYQDVQWRIGCVGCHTIVDSGSPITGLKYYGVKTDDRWVSLDEVVGLIADLATKAENIYKVIREKNFKELKELVMIQECYQLHKLFKAAGMDWHPTPQMKDRVLNKALLTGVVPLGKIMTNMEEYATLFHIDEFNQEVIQA